MVQLGQPIDSDPFAVVAIAVPITQTPSINHNPIPNQEHFGMIFSPHPFLHSCMISLFLYGTLKLFIKPPVTETAQNPSISELDSRTV